MDHGISLRRVNFFFDLFFPFWDVLGFMLPCCFTSRLFCFAKISGLLYFLLFWFSLLCFSAFPWFFAYLLFCFFAVLLLCFFVLSLSLVVADKLNKCAGRMAAAIKMASDGDVISAWTTIPIIEWSEASCWWVAMPPVHHGLHKQSQYEQNGE